MACLRVQARLAAPVRVRQHAGDDEPQLAVEEEGVPAPEVADLHPTRSRGRYGYTVRRPRWKLVANDVRWVSSGSTTAVKARSG